jgi:hypothetical protein
MLQLLLFTDSAFLLAFVLTLDFLLLDSTQLLLLPALFDLR